MQWYEILIIVLACAFVVGVVVWQILRKKKGQERLRLRRKLCGVPRVYAYAAGRKEKIAHSDNLHKNKRGRQHAVSFCFYFRYSPTNVFVHSRRDTANQP